MYSDNTDEAIPRYPESKTRAIEASLGLTNHRRWELMSKSCTRKQESYLERTLRLASSHVANGNAAQCKILKRSYLYFLGSTSGVDLRDTMLNTTFAMDALMSSFCIDIHQFLPCCMGIIEVLTLTRPCQCDHDKCLANLPY